MLGVDIVEVDRMKKAMLRQGDKFINRIFTTREISYCDAFKHGKYQHFAGRFAAKEAVAKVLEKGPRDYWHDIEIINNGHGKPTLILSKRLQKQVVGAIEISISHETHYAVAVAMLITT